MKSATTSRRDDARSPFGLRGTEVINLFRRFVDEDAGQDLIEYALLAAIIALGVIAAMTGVRDALNTQFNNISTTIATGS